jgi:long-chain acyl-CoA synthetase
VTASAAKSFPEFFFQTVERRADATALRHKTRGVWDAISWKEYGKRVDLAAAGFLSWGLSPGDRVAILGENRPEWVICHIGAMMAGCASCGIYPTSSPEEIQYIVSHSEAKALFVENEEQVEKVLKVIDDLFGPDAPSPNVVVWDRQGLWGFSHPRFVFFDEFMDRAAGFLEENPGEGKNRPEDRPKDRMDRLKPADIAMVIYTSGTTGRPKGAMISHGNILSLTESLAEVIGASEDDEMLSYLPLAHVYENLISVFLAVKSGGVVNFVESLDTLALNLREVSPTVFAGVPRIWEKFVSMVEIRMSDSTPLKRALYRMAQGAGLGRLRAPKGSLAGFLWSLAYWPLYWGVLWHLKRQIGLERVRYAVCGAAPAGLELFEWFNAMGIPLREGYGQTESTGVIAMQRLEGFRPGYVGEPLPGVEARIAEDGEILARGEGIFSGYFKNPELTKETIQDGWLHTGDIGVMDGGFLKILDRKKDIIITRGGKNVTPAFIENKLKFSVYIQDAVVIGEGRKYLTALILIDEDNVTRLAQDRSIPFTTFLDLTQNPDIIEVIQEEVERVNQTLARVETIKKFRLLPRRFYAEDGDVTPTQKVKRRSVEKTYSHLIELMYEGRPEK